ncbi:MAG: rhomboid family intramembrane serine protease [Solirubrobacterales bacterium]
MPEAGPELSVVCKNCGSEVSPYVTECPYCGTRLRKRAPKLERRGDELTPHESRRDRRRRLAAQRRAAARERIAFATERPYVTFAAILGPAVLLLVQRAADLSVFQVGAIDAPYTDAWWQYLAAPFVYDQLGYLFVIGVAMALFVPGLERRLGPIATLLLLVACGALGALAAPQLDDAFGDGITVIAGGNGLALGAVGAWFVLRRAESLDEPAEDFDWIPVTVAACVLLLLPLVDSYANPWSAIVGGAVGLGAGFVASRTRRA